MTNLISGFHHGAIDRIAGDMAHEASVDLQKIRLEGLEITERTQAGTEIIEREAATHAFEHRNKLRRTREIEHGRGFGDLETDLFRGNAGFRESIDDKL